MKIHNQLVLILIFFLVGMEQLTPVAKQISHKLKKRRFSLKKVKKSKDPGDAVKVPTKKTTEKKKEVKSIFYESSDDAVEDLTGLVSNAEEFLQKGKEILKSRDRYTETQAEFIASKAKSVIEIASVGISTIQSATDVLSKLADNAALTISILGPIGVGIALGVNILSMGVRLYNGEPLIPPSDKEVILQAITQTNLKIDALSEHLDNKLDDMKGFIALSISKTQYFLTEEKILYADKIFQEMKNKCTLPPGQEQDSDVNRIVKIGLKKNIVQDQKDKQKDNQEEMFRFESICELSQRKFYEQLREIEFSFHFNLFLKFFSGDAGLLGADYFQKLLEDSKNDFTLYDNHYKTFKSMATTSTLIFQVYKVIQQKFMVHDQLMFNNDQQMLNKAQGTGTDTESLLKNYKVLSAIADCEECLETSDEINKYFQTAEKNHQEIIGTSGQGVIDIQKVKGNIFQKFGAYMKQKYNADTKAIQDIEAMTVDVNKAINGCIANIGKDAEKEADFIIKCFAGKVAIKEQLKSFTFLLTIEKTAEKSKLVISHTDRSTWKKQNEAAKGFAAFVYYNEKVEAEQAKREEIIKENRQIYDGKVYMFRVLGTYESFSWQMKFQRKNYVQNQYQFLRNQVDDFQEMWNKRFFGIRLRTTTCNHIMELAAKANLVADVICQQSKGAVLDTAPGSFSFISSTKLNQQKVEYTKVKGQQPFPGQGTSLRNVNFLDVFHQYDSLSFFEASSPLFERYNEHYYTNPYLSSFRPSWKKEFEGNDRWYRVKKFSNRNKDKMYWIRLKTYQELDSYFEIQIEIPMKIGNIDDQDPIKAQSYIPDSGNELNKVFKIAFSNSKGLDEDGIKILQ